MPRLDPLLSLAFSMHENKGVYAVLLGSGVSRSAQIPTGWEIVLNLIERLARLQGAEHQDDLEKWYLETYGVEPDYSDILQQLADTPAERNGLLRRYFEPTTDERSEGIKVPTAAHTNVANLVARGYIRVILTTNFDRLLETALEAAGVQPVVISNADDTKGAPPLTHSSCTVIKLHGDYLDTRIRNTQDELNSYEEELDALLDRVFDEFGLIVCGWSAAWDHALRSAFARCPNRRFSTYWCARGQLGDEAEKLVSLRGARIVQISGANELFRDLEEKVMSLEDSYAPHPLTVKSAVSVLKKYLPDAQHRIRLHDFIHEQTQDLIAQLGADDFSPLKPEPTPDRFFDRICKYEELSKLFLTLFMHGAYWSSEHQVKNWTKALERLADSTSEGNGYQFWLKLELYPALMLMYIGGISSLAADRPDIFSHIVKKTTIGGDPMVSRLYPLNVIELDHARRLPGMEHRHTPLNDHMFEVLREPLRDILPQDEEYANLFDLFEYLYALTHAEYRFAAGGDTWSPVGRFGWRRTSLGKLSSSIDAELQSQGESWPFLRVGHFGENFSKVKADFDKMLSNLPWH